jgi:hypothetical protein
LELQEGCFTWINIRAIEVEVLVLPHELSLGFDFIKDVLIFAKVLSCLKNDCEVTWHDAYSSTLDCVTYDAFPRPYLPRRLGEARITIEYLVEYLLHNAHSLPVDNKRLPWRFVNALTLGAIFLQRSMVKTCGQNHFRT